MRIRFSYQGKESSQDFGATAIVIGRPLDSAAIDLDLTPDTKVSRPHARVWIEEGHYWIEDLNSTRGTQVNGKEIKGEGRRRLRAEDSVRIGETTLRVDISEETENSVKTLPPEKPEAELVGGITQSRDAVKPAFDSEGSNPSDRRVALFYELSLKFGEETQLDKLWQLVVERAVDVIPGASRGALLIRDRTTGGLLRKASLPITNPAVSTTLAQRAMERREAFIWSQNTPTTEDGEGLSQAVPGSAFEHHIESAIYAPLMWKGKALGVVCVDNCEACDSFQHDDLLLLQALAHHAATAVAHLHLQQDLQREIKVLNKFLKLVSPEVAERLRHRREQIHLGGEFHEATILFSDIRGFTKLSAEMDLDDVTDMLEAYFSRLVPIIFEHQGTIDKFVGDAIVAVFGCPQADEKQHHHAVQAALRMQAAVKEVNASRSAQGKRTAELGIGIHCGEVVYGFIGARERMEITVIGDAVNRASRYCDGAPGGDVLISPELYEWVWKAFTVEQTSIPTKHEGDLSAYCIMSAKA